MYNATKIMLLFIKFKFIYNLNKPLDTLYMWPTQINNFHKHIHTKNDLLSSFPHRVLEWKAEDRNQSSIKCVSLLLL